MRRPILTLLLAALAVVITVPLGAAWTFERRTPLATPAFVHKPHTTSASGPAVLPEAGALMLTGGVLIGLAVAVRRAS